MLYDNSKAYNTIVPTASYPGPQRPMLAAQLRLASEACHSMIFDRLRTRGFADLRQSHFDLFRFPGPQSVTPTQLAAHVGLTKQALNPLLNELQDMGYLNRITNPNDGRSRELQLTPRGLALVTVIREALEELETRTRDRLGMRRYEDLLNAVDELRALALPADSTTG